MSEWLTQSDPPLDDKNLKVSKIMQGSTSSVQAFMEDQILDKIGIICSYEYITHIYKLDPSMACVIMELMALLITF